MLKTSIKRADQNESADNVIFYCKDCEKIVKTRRVGKKYVYKCAECGTKNVAFGTPKSIYSYFRLQEEKSPEKEKK